MTAAEAESIVARLPPLFAYRDALSAGLSKHHFYRLRAAHRFEEVSTGLYKKRGEELAHLELAVVASRVPRATLCLASALSRHELTDAIPSHHELAVPRGTRVPVDMPAVQWHRFDAASFDVGREVLPRREGMVGLYSAERSIVDAFRLKGIEGEELGLEALKRWLRRSAAHPSQLLRVAEQFPAALPSLRRALQVLL